MAATPTKPPTTGGFLLPGARDGFEPEWSEQDESLRTSGFQIWAPGTGAGHNPVIEHAEVGTCVGQLGIGVDRCR